MQQLDVTNKAKRKKYEKEQNLFTIMYTCYTFQSFFFTDYLIKYTGICLEHDKMLKIKGVTIFLQDLLRTAPQFQNVEKNFNIKMQYG